MNHQPTLFDRCFKDEKGNLALGAKPNLPLIVAVVFAVLALLPVAFVREFSIIVAFGSFFVWGWLELFEGVNYFRRALGLSSLVLLIGIAIVADFVQS